MLHTSCYAPILSTDLVLPPSPYPPLFLRPYSVFLSFYSLFRARLLALAVHADYNTNSDGRGLCLPKGEHDRTLCLQNQTQGAMRCSVSYLLLPLLGIAQFSCKCMESFSAVWSLPNKVVPLYHGGKVQHDIRIIVHQLPPLLLILVNHPNTM